MHANVRIGTDIGIGTGNPLFSRIRFGYWNGFKVLEANREPVPVADPRGALLRIVGAACCKAPYKLSPLVDVFRHTPVRVDRRRACIILRPAYKRTTAT